MTNIYIHTPYTHVHALFYFACCTQKILEKEIKGGKYVFYNSEYYDQSNAGGFGELILDYYPEKKVWSKNESCCMTSFSLNGPHDRYTVFTIPIENEMFEKIIYVNNNSRWYFLTEN